MEEDFYNKLAHNHHRITFIIQEKIPFNFSRHFAQLMLHFIQAKRDTSVHSLMNECVTIIHL